MVGFSYDIFMKCKLCASENTESIRDLQFDVDYFHCLQCDLIFINPKKVVSVDEEKRQYDLHENTIECEGYVRMFRDFIAIIRRECSWIFSVSGNIKTALDFGSGPGPVLAELLKQESFQVDIYDPIYAPELSGKQYDLITSTEVFEHFKNPIDEIKLLKKHLKKGSILAIMTLFHPQSEADFLNWWYRRDPTHISFYSPETFEFIAERFGFKIVFCDKKRIIILKKS